MRVYLHFEPAAHAPPHTLAFELDLADAGPVSRALSVFASEYSRAHPTHELRAAELALVDARGTTLRPTQPLLACVADRSDLFVCRAEAALPPPPAPRMEAIAPSALPVPAAVSARAAPAAKAVDTAEQTARVKALVAQGEEAFKVRRYRDAAAAFEGAIALNPRHRASLSRLAEIELECKRPGRAAALLERACDAARATALSAPTTPLLIARLAETYTSLCRPREAVALLREALDLCPEGEGGSAGAARRARLLAKLGRALYNSGEREAGADLFMAVLDKDSEQVDALAEYAAVALECGQLEDALKVNLRLIVSKPNDPPTRKALARAVAADSECAMLFEQLAPSASAAPAHAFLATVVKDFSALDASERLYRAALAHATADTAPSYALNLMHVLELSLRYEEALRVLREHLTSQPPDRIIIGPPGLTAGQALALLSKSGADVSETLPRYDGVTRRYVTPARPAGLEAPPAPVAGAGASLPKESPLSAQGAPGGAGGAQGAAGGLSQPQLDTLALLMTACKVLFVQGRLGALPALINAIEPLRAGRELHRTFVRNEHAYYCCIAQLLPSLVTPPSLATPPEGAGLPVPDAAAHAGSLDLPAHDAVLHVLGDSHCLPYGWRLLALAGQRVLLRPGHVTGLKVWHLRDESRFFPKANFAHAGASVPEGGRAVALFGEIDCREALLLCVERKRYESIDEGANLALDVYIDALRELARARKLERLWVHAVPPVLEETRPVVRLFNRLLAEKVRAAGGKLSWLEGLEDAMLDPSAAADGEPRGLNPSLRLDGTHMHPHCAELLRAALERSGWEALPLID